MAYVALWLSFWVNVGCCVLGDWCKCLGPHAEWTFSMFSFIFQKLSYCLFQIMGIHVWFFIKYVAKILLFPTIFFGIFVSGEYEIPLYTFICYRFVFSLNVHIHYLLTSVCHHPGISNTVKWVANICGGAETQQWNIAGK